MKIEKYYYEGQHEGQNSNRDVDRNIGLQFDCGHAIHVEKPKEFVRICKEEIE